MSKNYSQWAFKPAFLLPGIFLAASCGSSPEPEPAPSPELEVTMEIPSADDLLEEQLAEMGAALADGEQPIVEAEPEAQPEPQPGEPGIEAPAGSDDEVAEADTPGAAGGDEVAFEEEPEQADMLADLPTGPSQPYLVDTIDGIPVSMGFGPEFLDDSFGYVEPDEPEEVAEVEASEDQAEQPGEVAAADMSDVEGGQPVEVAQAEQPEDSLAESVEDLADASLEELVAELVDPEQPVSEEPVEVAVAEDVEPTADELVAEADEPTADESIEVAPEGEQPTEVAAAMSPEDFLWTSHYQPMDPAILFEVAQSADEPVADQAEESGPGVIELAGLAGPVAEPETLPLELFPAEEPAVEPVEVAEAQPEGAQQAPEPEEVLEQTPDFVEQPAEALAADLANESVVAEAPVAVAFDPDVLIWLDPPTPAEVLETEVVDQGSLHAGRMVPATLAELPAHWSFMADLEPAERLLLAPTLVIDPSGGVARIATDSSQLFEVSSVGLAPPEYVDPAIAALPGERRIDGSQFGPVASEDLLVDDPGLGMIWWGNEVPFEHVDSKVDIQTPSVGRVRVVLESGDYVEGVLHAVGAGKYWINGDLGRFAVKSNLVSHVKHLPKPGLGIEIVGLQAGDLVRVKAKSGYVEGRLVSMKGDDVLIETADGMRVTLPGDDVQPMGDSATRVVLP